MSSPYAAPVQALIDELGRLPGVGPKSAQRIAFHILKAAPEDANRLARVIMEAKERVTWCRRCFNISEGEICAYCSDERRDSALLCVVEEPRDIVAVERTHEFGGRYHVLQGATLWCCPGASSIPTNCASRSSWAGSTVRASPR